jgi:hypothetical protein
MLEGRKYVLGQNCGLIFGKTTYPENTNYMDDNPVEIVGEGIGMLIHMNDVEIDPVIVMNKKQAKALVKALKKSMRRK